MRNITANILLAFATQVHAKELATNHLSPPQDSMDVVDQVEKLVNELLDRTLKALPVQNANLDDILLAKPGHLASPPRMNFRPLATAHAFSRNPVPHPLHTSSSKPHWAGQFPRKATTGYQTQIFGREQPIVQSGHLSVLATAAEFPPASRYTWRGHSCSFVKAGQGPPILLLHGFAGSAFNCWRSTVPALAETHTVYALDLLGLGASDQPTDVEYSIDLWREQCEDFIREQMPEPPIIIGHSFGSLIALELVRKLAAKGTPVPKVGLMNCAVGMNNKNALKVLEWRREQAEKGVDVGEQAPEWQFRVFGAVLSLVDVIFNQKWLLSSVLENFATAENVRGALQNSVYANSERVTDDLVNDYLSLAKNKNAAVEVLRQIYTNDAGPLPFLSAQSLPDDFPILVVWGDSDNLAPISGPVGSFFRKRSEDLKSTKFVEVASGHVPQDDNPDLTNSILKDWLKTVPS